MLGGECTLRDVVRITCIFFFSFYLRYIYLVHRPYDHIDMHCTYLLYMLIYVASPIFACVVSFLSLYTWFLFLYAIYYFCFTQRCLDEFCLKCFRNTDYQSLLAINSLLAKFFKSLC